MLSQQDLLSVKKVYQQPHERKQNQSDESSIVEDNQLQELYFSRYFLNNSFKILHIDIVGTEQVCSYEAKYDSFIIYIIRVITEDFSYEVKKRYNQFLRLYQKLKSFEAYKIRMLRGDPFDKKKIQMKSHIGYNFPTKKISSSVKTFLKISNKLTLASQRKSELRNFLNQIRNNYGKFSDYFTDDYVELLKFLNTKQQHKKYWRLKQGRFIQLFQADLKSMNQNTIGNLNKIAEQNNNSYNIDYLTELLQHQINKINLAILTKTEQNRGSKLMSQMLSATMPKDPLVNEQIIKNAECIKDIVLELKKKISYDHIKCIMKGKDIKQTVSVFQAKKGLIEFSLKYCTNELVSIHILKVILQVFLNSESNYSFEAFLKILAEIEMEAFTLSQQREKLALGNKQFRQCYFKLLNQYIQAKLEYGADKKYNGQQFPFSKIMSLMLYSIYLEWNTKCEKNKEFKLKDEQKQWSNSNQNPVEGGNLKKSYFLSYQEEEPNYFQFVQLENHIEKSQEIQYSKKSRKQTICEIRQSLPKSTLKQIKSFMNQNLMMNLRTEKKEQYSHYILRAEVKDKKFQTCLEIMKNQQKWNKLILSTQFDSYSNTRKDFIKIPEKHQRIFRFTEHQQIEMDLPSSEEQKQFESILENYVTVQNQQQFNQNSQFEKNPKMSTQTMPSTSGSCAHNHQPQRNQKVSCDDLADSTLSRKISMIKLPPNEKIPNSYFQSTKIQRFSKDKRYDQFCLVELEIIFLELSSRKYFSSEVSGQTSYIWEGIKNALLQ